MLLHRLKMWLMLPSGLPHARHALLLPGKTLAPARTLPKSRALSGLTLSAKLYFRPLLARYRHCWRSGKSCGYHFNSMLAATATFRIAASVARMLQSMCGIMLRQAKPASGGGMPFSAAHRDDLLWWVQHVSALLAAAMISSVRRVAWGDVHLCKRPWSERLSLIASIEICIQPKTLIAAVPGKFGSHPNMPFPEFLVQY